MPTAAAADALRAGDLFTPTLRADALALYVQRGIGSLNPDFHVHCSTEFCRTHLFGRMDAQPTRPPSPHPAIERYRTFDAVILAAESGNADAEFTVAEVLSGGHGVPANPRRAAHWYRRAALHGHTLAASRLNRLRGVLAASE